MDTLHNVQLALGIVITILGSVFGIWRIYKVPQKQNFSKVATIRAIIYLVIMLAGGISLIIFSFV